MKDLTLALKLCAFSLATVLVRHISTEKNLKEYFNSEELAIEVKDLENGASEQYLVDPKALVRLNTRCHLVFSEGGEAAAGYCLNSVSYRVDEAVKYNVLNSD